MLSRSLLKKSIVISLASISIAASSPKVGDSIELDSYLNARSTAQFRNSDNKNIKRILPTGTRAVVHEVKRFNSGNFGLCLQDITLPNQKTENNNSCIWVYYNTERPALKLYEMQPADQISFLGNELPEAQVTSSPETATATETTSEVSATVENDTIMSADNDTSSALIAPIVQTVANLNNNPQFPPQAAPCDGNCNEPTVQYEQCASTNQRSNNKNDQIEGLLGAIKNENTITGYLMRNPAPESIRASCVKAAMATASKSSNSYRYCDSAGGMHRMARPCMSENYTNMVTQSLNAANHCMKDYLSPQGNAANRIGSLFNLMSWESGLHPGAISSRRAAGMGQLTASAIADVNNTRLQGLRNHLENHSDPVCKAISKTALANIPGQRVPMRSSVSNLCDRFEVGGNGNNPLKNILYTMAYQQIAKSSLVRSFFSDDSRFSNVFSGLSEADREHLINQLSIWSHNTGPGGMQHSLRQLLRCSSALQKVNACNGPISQVTDVNRFLKSVALALNHAPHPANSSRSRRNETSTFYNKIEGRKQLIETAAGGLSCVAG